MIEIHQRVLEWLYGATPDTRVTLEHSLPIAPGLVFLLWCGAALWAFACYRRCRDLLSRPAWYSLLVLRIAAITVLLGGMLAGWQLTREKTDRPDLLVFIDDSASMLQVDRYDGKAEQLLEDWFEKSPRLVTRLDIAKKLLTADSGKLLKQWQRRYRLRVIRVATTSRELDGRESIADQIDSTSTHAEQIEYQASRLGEEIVRQLRTQRARPLAAIVVLTDGVTTVGRSLQEAAEYARRKNVPLFCLGIGDTVPSRDAEVREVLADRTAFLGDLVHVDVTLAGRELSGETLKVRLFRQGETEPLDTQSVAAPLAGQTTLQRLSFRPTKLGEEVMMVRVEPLRDEVNLTNNAQPFRIDIRDETIRVLYIQGYPSPDFRFLRMSLQRKRKLSDTTQPAVQLTTIQLEAETGYEELDAAATVSVPVELEQLTQFDVILLGDVPTRRLPAEFQKALLAFVSQRGGGLVLLCGPRHSPQDFVHSELASLFPFHLDTAKPSSEPALARRGVYVRPTQIGMQQPAIQLAGNRKDTAVYWTTMPPIRWFVQIQRIRPAAHVWLEVHAPGLSFDAAPVVLSQYVGAGRVVVHLTDESYRWSRHVNGEFGYENYWMQLLRYLSRSKMIGDQDSVVLSSDKEVFDFQEQVTLRVRFFDNSRIPEDDHAVRVELTRNGTRTEEFVLSRRAGRRSVFGLTLSDLEAGTYLARMVTPSTDGEPAQTTFRIRGPQGEMEDLELNEVALRDAGKKSGGRYVRWAHAEKVLAGLPDGRRVHVSTLPPHPLWNSHFMALLFVGLLGVEWALRRKWGLV
jgi:hypothetical protein